MLNSHMEEFVMCFVFISNLFIQQHHSLIAFFGFSDILILYGCKYLYN